MITLGINVSKTTPYHPQSNGMDERFKATLMNKVKAYASIHQKDWDSQLIWALYNYNTTVHESTRYSPYHLLYGLEPRNLLRRPRETDFDLNAPMMKDARDLVRREALMNVDYTQKISKYYYDLKHAPQQFETGDLVLRKVHTIPTSICRKLAHKYEGPYVVIKLIGDVTKPKAVLIGDLTDFTRRKVPFADLKLYHPPSDIREPAAGQVEDPVVTQYLKSITPHEVNPDFTVVESDPAHTLNTDSGVTADKGVRSTGRSGSDSLPQRSIMSSDGEDSS